jgi:hypothetical protein
MDSTTVIYDLLKEPPVTTSQQDDRTAEQQARDEAIAAEPPLAPPDLPDDGVPVPVEALLQRMHKPIAVPGVIENGMARPLDQTVQLPEHSRVFIIARVTTP